MKPTLLETKKSSSGDKFKDALKRDRSEATEGERVEELLSDSEEDLDTGRPLLKREWQGPIILAPRESYWNKASGITGWDSTSRHRLRVLE